MGDLGLLGISKPAEFGGMGLDYSYQVVFAEELGLISKWWSFNGYWRSNRYGNSRVG
jgi:alkylation response protein AidB-like acyl-CoA dehydrogenase